MKLGIRAKLLCTFGIGTLLTIIVGGVGIIQAGAINDRAGLMYSEDLTGMSLVATLTRDTILVRAKVAAHILATDPAKKTAIEADLAQLDKNVDTTLQAIRDGDSDGREQVAQFTDAWTRYTQTRDTVTLPASRAGKTDQAQSSYNGAESTQFDAVSSSVTAVITTKTAQAGNSAAENTDSYSFAGWLILGTTALAVLLVLGLSWLLARNITGTATQVVAVAQGLARGDLTQQLTVRSGDELGAMADALRLMIVYQNRMAQVATAIAAGSLTVEVEPQSAQDTFGVAFQRMIGNLRTVMQEMREAVEVLTTAASEIAAATNQVAAGAAQTASAVAETTVTVEEVKQTTQLAAEKAGYVSDSAQHSATVSQAGSRAVEEAMDGMERIRAQMEAVADSVVFLSEQRQAISEIIASVNDLAEQSNLLSVNAAIEAAKAGEHGRGFTVVAQEVKRLAEQSKQATAQVRSILSDIEKATTASVMATDEGNKAVAAGVVQSAHAGESIRALAESIEEAQQAATQIAVSSQQQRIGMDQIALAMENIKAASLQNVVGTKQTAASAQNLHDLGQKLKHLVSRYQV